MTDFLVGGCTLGGLLVGSFLNVIIWRLPRHESIVSPRSACPTCHVSILARDNIPVVSWLLLHGRCRHCRVPIAYRYPLVELLCAVLFAGAAVRFGAHWDLAPYLVLFAGLLALAWIDAEQLVLPRRLVYAILGADLALYLTAALATHEWHRLDIALACSGSWFVLFFILNVLSPRALGFGDVRLAWLLGLSLGWLGVPYVLLGFFLANFIGAVVGVSLLAAKRLRRGQPIAYGTFLAVGTTVAVLGGSTILTPFSRYW